MAVKDGRTYLNRINQANADIWIQGERIRGPVSDHPALRGILASQAELYDRQSDERLREVMTYRSPLSGEPVGLSYMQPRTKEDLAMRRRMIQEWAGSHCGMMGRSPDYMNTALMALAAAAKLFAEDQPQYAENLVRYYEYCRENDITLTHSFVSLQTDRSALFEENPKLGTTAAIVGKQEDGIVIHGARPITTQGGITDEILVCSPPAHPLWGETFHPHAFAFAIPVNSPGLRFICRESFDYGKSEFDHPLGSRFDEIDTLVVFDQVLVPWDRVFLCGNAAVNNSLFRESSFYPLVSHQVVSRYVVKTEFLLGIAELLAESINIKEYPHVRGKLAELILALETWKSHLISSEAGASMDRWGTMVPDWRPLAAATLQFPKLYPRFLEILQLLGASGLMMIPEEEAFRSELRQDLDAYLGSAALNAYDRVRLSRLAWDACMSAFGSRQLLYERFFFGDPERSFDRLYGPYDLTGPVGRVRRLLGLSDEGPC